MPGSLAPAEGISGRLRWPERRVPWAWAGLLLGLMLLGAAWSWTPLREWLRPQQIAVWAEPYLHSRLLPLYVLAAYVVAGVAIAPVMALIVATGLLYDLLPASVLSLCGCLLSAALLYGLGRVLGRDPVRRLAGSRLDRLAQHLTRRGVLSMAVIRVLPIAPYSVVNLVAGALRFRFRDFLLGSALGLTPGIVAASLLAERVGVALRQPGPWSLALLAGLALALLGGGLWLRRRLSAQGLAQRPGPEAPPAASG
jgi:uncharacterized membrane protein YdjX (TVP38/TMEM64 family)